MEAQSQNESTKETFKFINVSQRTRMSRNNSKERICNVIHPNPNYSDHMRGKSNSRLPRIVRTTSKLKPTDTSPKMIEDSGDSPPGPSKLTGFTMKMKKEDIPENLKTSHIPRRKSNKDGIKESNDCIMKNPTVTNNQFIPETKNVQRVNMLINPEFCSEERVPASKQSTRPIPTLGQIYGRVNMIDSDRLNDWFMELNTPMNSIASNPRPASYGVGHEYNDCISSTEASPAHCHQSDLQRSTIVLDRKNNLMNGFQSANDTVNAWIPSELEFPTRDNESGYKTMSSKNQPKSIQPQYVSKPVDSQPVKPNNTYCLGLDSYDSSKTSSMLGQSNECSTATSSLLKEQQTVVLCQTPEVKQKVEEGTNVSKNSVDLKPTRISKNEEDKSYHYPSHVVQNTDIRQHRAPVPSYTECLSEILQKTTNFEIMEGIESPKTPSSAGATDIEYRDNLSNDGNMDALDDFTTAEEQSAQEWRRPPFHSNANMTFVKSDDTATNWSCRYRSETSDGCLDDHHHNDSYQLKHEYYKKFYDDSHSDSRGRCKKCQGFKRFPSSRYNLPRTFGSWRQRLSIRRICRRRWNHVWKKTAERWASWSRYTRPPAKFRRFRVMHYLQRSLVWEDADVQTNIHVYHETGTCSSVKEQKSAAIGTVFNMETWNAIANRTDTAVGTMSNNTRIRHVNLGPSMFPFLYNSKRKPAPIQTLDKTQSPYFQDMDSSVSGNTLNDNFAWNDGDVCNCNSIRSCQFQVTDPMPETVEQSTSLSESDESNLADELTDTMGLSYSMSDKVTSTVVKFNPGWPGNRLETEVTFLPMFGNSSTGTITSGGDITFYRPLAGTDISHLITESRTQQALYPILRKFNSNGPTLLSRDRSTATEAETQISGNLLPDKISTGTATFNPVLTENATSYTPTVLTPPRKTSTEKAYAECKVQTDIPKSEPKSVSTSIGKVLPEKAEFTTQTEIFKPVPKSDLETQMSPVHSHSVSTYTHSYPMFGNRQSAFISACVLVNNEEDKESFAVETQSKMPPALAYAGTNIVSISSRQLAGTKGDISKTDKPRPGSSKLKPKLIRKPPPITTCGTDAMGWSPSETVTQSSSTRGLDSYYETEILLNNLIKKALIGDGSHHSRYSSERSGSQQLMCVTTYTNTHVGLETRGIGPTASDISKLTGIDKTDTSVQYMEDGGGKEQNTVAKEAVECGTGGDWTDSLQAQKPLHQCASVMTAYCGHAEAVQVSSAQATTTDEGNDPEYIDKQLCNCACESAVVSHDTETNTETQPVAPISENTAQASILKTEEAKSCSKISNNKSKSKVEFQNDSTHHKISLPRIFGKKKSLTPVKLPPAPTFSTPLCKDSITADQWINECPSKEKTYESLLMSKDEEEKEQIQIVSSKPEPEESPIIIPMGLPPLSVSKDSLADVFPIKKSKDFFKKLPETLVTVNRVMVDEITSGLFDTKDKKEVKESIQQACPEICETGTESSLCQRSASVLTTQCVLPAPLPCEGKLIALQAPTECVFVYGEPRCAIHKTNTDAAVQMHPRIKTASKPKRGVCHSVGMLTSLGALREEPTKRKPNSLIREVLSPKVYKALYETTKRVVNEETKQQPISVKDAIVGPVLVDAEVEATRFHMGDVRSAGVVTSLGRGFDYPMNCYCKDLTHSHNKCAAVYHVAKVEETTETAPNTHAKLLNMPEENKEGCFEDCVKTHLVTSCRYYSNLLTKHLGRVKENLTKHLASPIEPTVEPSELPPYPNLEACTMKPSGRSAFASQTLKYNPYHKSAKHLSCCVLSPATSLTDICKHDKDHLKSVYYMLSAIEGRLRRLKLNSPNSYVRKST